MFKKILIANRGEIAVRVIVAAKELGIQTVAIYSDADKNARHVKMADEHRQLEGQPARVYLDSAQIIEIAKTTGADAVHPGYGFLSENGDFAQACLDAGIKFIGPKPDVIRSMGSKVEARRTMEAAGVPVVPGTTEAVTDPAVVKSLATKYGYPLAIKASAGGGGRGLKVVRTEHEIEAALTAAQREGASYFGSGDVYVEKYLDVPRHIEVQIMGDEHGNVIHLGERDCSSQRRHQKLLEETPAAKLESAVRTKLLEAAVRGAKALQYSSAGTMEFLVSGNQFYFLEVNTRVQVEHPITEIVTGVDIVKEQILIASGKKLSLTQADVGFRGHAIEFRINAEDASKNFIPSPGTITKYEQPSFPWVRLDSACYEGYQVLPFYDSLLAKLVVWGSTREEAIIRGKIALTNYIIEGLSTTIPFHLALLDDPKFKAGEMNTKYVESDLIKTFMAQHPSRTTQAVPNSQQKQTIQLSAPDPKQSPQHDSKPAVSLTNNGHCPPSGQPKRMRSFDVEVNDRVYKVSVTEHSSTAPNGATHPVGLKLPSTKTTERPTAKGAKTANDNAEVKSTMNGVIKEVFVIEGEAVTEGQRLLLLEAMKMESEIFAQRAGIVKDLFVKAGAIVDSDTKLLIIANS